MSGKGANSIQVCIKLRPCEPGQPSLWQVKEGRSIQLADTHAEPSVFDYVFDEGASNQEVFDRMAQHIVRACMQGFNGTIFAYGQTSSGKTYTMMGDGQNPGVMVLAAKEIFQQIANETERDFLLRVGYIEIYNEKIYDLLNKKNQDLKIHEAGNGIVNVNCEECIITSEDDLLRLLCLGNKERTVGETNMNERSSRSHAIFRIIIESRKSDRNEDDAVIQSVLNLVDLAGSERADQTGATGARLKEGAHINKSLMFLSNVIKNLSENVDNKFISFRDSKLTRILQASLGGNAFTSIICTIKPSIMEESQSTLNFAMRAKKIRIKPQLNEMVSDATMMKRLEREIKTLKSQLAEEKRKKESQLTVQDLERRLKTDMLKIISSTSLSDQRQQKRRRTWCPAPTGQEASLSSLTGILNDSRLMRASNMSNLPKPQFFPNSNFGYREKTAPKTINILSSLDITTENNDGIEERFQPVESVDFGTPPPLFVQNPKLKSRKLPDLALTPVPNQMGPETMEKIKKEIEELQTFTSLEKHFDVEWTEAQILKENLEKVTAQRDQLEQDCITKAERCDAMQAEVTTLTVATEAANSKIVEYEEELKALKQNIAKLELENREAVSLEFQFEAYKKKSSLREKDLLSALADKDSAIENLQKSFDDLSRDMVRNSKESLMRSMCPNLAEIGEMTLNESGQVACECDKLRSEVVAAKAKLEKVQADFDLAVSEATQRKGDCQRLSEQITKAEDDFALLQGRYEALELQRQNQQGAIETLQADFQAIQHKYQKLQEEYESLGRTSNASEEQCQQLQADNTRLQVEIGALKARVEEAQRMLMQAPSLETIDEEFKAQNEVLKAQLAEMEVNFNQIQEEYDSLSSQLLESVQENDALREELKQRSRSSCGFDSMKSSGVDSMKSSGVGTEFGEPEPEPDSHLLEQFVQLSASLHQIELKNHSGFSRLFRVANLQQEQDEKVTGFKLCLESGKYIEGETHQTVASDGIHLKGVLKQQMFQFVALSQEQLEAGEEKLLLNIISQLEQEIKEKNELLEATEATINEMREQMTNLESELLEKSVIVNKVEDYQRQIESLEKQKAEMTMVCEELQDKVHRNSTMSESLLHILPMDDTISGPHDSSQEVASLRASLAELKAKVCELQAEVESQLKQMQLKDGNIAELKSEVEEMSERCLSTEVRLVEVENNVREKQQLLDRQSQRLSDDALLIDQLQERNARLQERNIKAEELQARQDKTDPSSEYEKQIEELRESLRKVNAELITKETLKIDEINALQLEFMVKMEASENENRTKFRDYILELQESKERYEADIATLKEQLLQAEEELSRVKERCQAELEENRATLKEKLSQVEAERQQVTAKGEAKHDVARETLDMEHRHQAELEVNTEILKEKLSEAEAKAAQHQAELGAIKETLKEQLAEAEANQAYIGAKEAALAEQESALNRLKMENQQLLEQLQVLSQADSERHSDLLASNDKIQDLQAKCEQQAADLDTLNQQKMNLQSDINEAHLQHLSTKNNLQKLEQEMEVLSQQKVMAEKDLDKQNKAFTAKICELEEALQSSQLNAVSHGDLVSRHKELIASSNGKIQELQEKYEQQLRDMDVLRQEKSLLQVKIEEADAQHSATLKKLHDLEMELDDMSRKKEREKSDLQEKLETITAKISDLEAELQSAKRKACSYDDLISEHEKLKSSLSEASGVSSNLQDKVDSLQSQLLASGQEVSNRDLQINELRSELRHALEAKDMLATQLQALEETMSSKAGRFQKEVADLNGSLNELQLKLTSLQELKNALETDNDELKVKLRNSKNLQSQLEGEQKACSSLRAKIVELEEASTRLEEQLRSKEAELKQKCSDMSQKVVLGRHSIEELTKECDQLRSDMKTKTVSFQREKEGLDSTISTLLRDKQLLEEEIKSLNLNSERNAELMSQLSAKEAESESLREASIHQKLAAEAANNKCLQMEQKVEKLTKESDKLRSDLQTKTMSFQREKESLDSTVSTLLREKQLLEEEIKSLNLNSERNAELMAQLSAKEAESESLREASIHQKLAAEAANNKCLQMEELTKEIEKLRTTMKSKECHFLTERERMNATISSLLEDKRNLEEKQCTLNEIVTKLEAELSVLQAPKTNTSFESNTSSASVSSVARKSLDRSAPRKSGGFESEVRKSRRLSAYDEHRRQSYWNDVRDCGTMTDPVDNNCNCTELDSKLQACQQELFIRESQVTALNMELKHHPLKDENAQLKKRVLEEQEKARSEQKRLKMKIQDLNARVNDLSNAAALVAKSPQAEPSSKPASASVLTQTEECQLEKKYSDALVLLRSRYHLIKDLEEKLKQNENSDTSNVSSLTSGKIHLLTKQCEALKKDLAAVREKYEMSKRVLMMRKEEMAKLHDKLAAYESKTK